MAPFSAVERSLILSSWYKSVDASSELLQLAKYCVDGDYAAVLTSTLVASLLAPASRPFDPDNISVGSLIAHIQPRSADDELLCLVTLCAALEAFLQTNWTGPDLPDTCTPLSVLKISPNFVSEEAFNRTAVAELAYGGEPAYHLASHVAFLRIAQILAGLTYTHLDTATWWRLRVWTVHLYMLDEPVALPSDVSSFLAEYRPANPDLVARYLLEVGLLDHLFHSDKQAAERFVEAAKSTGLQYELTGALGKRTKFQVQEHSQLVLLAQSKTSTVPSTETAAVPETLALNDDTLLEHTQFTSSSGASQSSTLGHLDPGNQPELDPLDQCILLAMCLNVRNTSPAHGLTNEQMAPYVARVISHPRNWSVHTMALLLRSRLESSRTRTVERSTLQLQALIDQMPTSDSAVDERLRYIFDLALPSKWQLERELATRMMGLGVVKSALDIFMRLEMWEEAVQCYALLEMPDAGIKIVRDLLSGDRVEVDERMRGSSALDKAREAKLWCLLGDLSGVEEREKHYLHAWALSGHTSGRAARSLGAMYFALKRFDDAVPYLEQGARINPLMARTWFLLGCTHMQRDQPDWKGAREAFARCVAIDEEHGEAWSNLASCYLRMGDADEVGKDVEQGPDDSEDVPRREELQYAHRLAAFRALRQGLKFSYDNWKMWENYMLVALEVGELHECIRALGRVVEERAERDGAASVDEDVLDRLVSAATRGSSTSTIVPSAPVHTPGHDLGAIPEDEEQEPAPATVPTQTPGSLVGRVNDLFERTILPRVSSPRIFKAYARLKTVSGEWSDALKAHLDAYRATPLTNGPWDTVASWNEALHEVEEIVDVLRNLGPRAEGGSGSKWKLQARGLVRTFASRSKDFQDEPEWAKVEAMQEELKKRGE
ncbi:TPR-like protein [Exidia glandulosa HHB12029]|uniref:TPR-like protein n=1 Tax=Exidia glandulosa HHB12029 TaxID=1314781 RepID=A0A165I8X8_EXIGL|nr:TPR-like protein [Exidia glandulosa HHB12029]